MGNEKLSVIPSPCPDLTLSCQPNHFANACITQHVTLAQNIGAYEQLPFAAKVAPQPHVNETIKGN